MKLNHKFAFAITTLATVGALLVGSSAFAQTNTSQGGQAWGGQGKGGMQMNMHPGVFGQVSAINGTTLTVTSKGFNRPVGHASSTAQQTTTTTTYSVDASSATVLKNNATSSLSSVAVGDTVMVQGTVSGTNVTATEIRDGVVPMTGGRGGNGQGMGGPHASSTQMMFPAGNGEPVVGGTVSAVSGSSITMTNNKGSNTYTIDASSATVMKGNATSSISNVVVGDNILVQGTVNGNAVTASSIIDQGAPKTSSNSSSSNPVVHAMGGIFGGIGSFFKNIFGFF